MQYLRRLSPRPVKRTEALPHKVVGGLFSIRSGLTRGAELMVADMRSTGRDVTVVDLTGATGETPTRGQRRGILPSDLASGAYDVIVHLNPPTFGRALAAFDPRILARGRVIGFWAWELERVPESWTRAAVYCDEIWAPSPFVAAAIERSVDFAGPVRCVPHPVDAAPFPPASLSQRRQARAKLGLRADDFVCGFSFSMRSNYARKNPLGAVHAFLKAFPTDRSARMIVRCADSPQYFPEGWAELREAACSDPRIILVTVNRLGISELYAAIDVYLSLHRSEGYGLPLAEAAQAGRAVIATSWGLAPDLAAHPLVTPVGHALVPISDRQGVYASLSDCCWAEPDVDEAATILIALAKQKQSRADVDDREPEAAVASRAIVTRGGLLRE